VTKHMPAHLIKTKMSHLLAAALLMAALIAHGSPAADDDLDGDGKPDELSVSPLNVLEDGSSSLDLVIRMSTLTAPIHAHLKSPTPSLHAYINEGALIVDRGEHSRDAAELSYSSYRWDAGRQRLCLYADVTGVPANQLLGERLPHHVEVSRYGPCSELGDDSTVQSVADALGNSCDLVVPTDIRYSLASDPGRTNEWLMADCKRRPDNLDTLLAVVPMSAVTGELRDLQILVIDLPRQTVVARRVERNVLEGDAIYVNAVALDTARYALSPKQRAFGVRVRWKGSSGPNPYSRETLSLYTVSSPRIERNLAGLVTWERWGEWDMDCTGTFSSVSRMISVAPREEGDARLNVTQKTKDERMTKTPTGCATAVVREAVRRKVLSVADGKYVVPSTMQAPGP
jgi:hypothetical protein